MLAAKSERLDAYTRIIRNLDVGFVLFDLVLNNDGDIIDACFIEVNPAFERLIGFNADSLIGRNVKEIAPSIEKSWFDFANQAVRTNKALLTEIKIDSIEKWCEMQIVPVSNKQIAVFFMDITTRKKSEEALKESEERFQIMANGIPAMLWVTDPDGNNLFVNKYYKEYFQIDLEQVVGNRWQSFLHPDDRQKYADEFFFALRERKPFFGQARLKPDGDLIWVETTAMPRYSSSGEFLGYVGLTLDITERKKTQELATIGATAGMVGHDIRNPLQAIMSDIYLLKDELNSMSECKDKGDVEESIDSIEENVSYINKIVADLQDFTRQITPEYSEVNFSDILVKVFTTVKVPETVKLAISVEDLEKFRCDPILLQRAITNLVTNAIQAMPQGGNLEIRGCSADNRTIFTISDTGVGIPDELKPRLFTPMVTTKAKGQGFGLAVSKRLVEAMKGSIRFESEKGTGTKFIVDLPTQ